MGYITEFGERLAEMLSGLPEERRRAIVTFVKTELYQSYKNGLRDAREKKQPRHDKRPAHR